MSESLGSELPDLDGRNVVATCFFRYTHDPQHGVYVPDKLEYVREWVETCDAALSDEVDDDPVGVVFCNGVSDSVKSQIDSYERVYACEYAPVEGFSTNDERFFCYRDFLRRHDLRYVFFTDGNDVKVKNNPFGVVYNYDRRFFLGKDMDETPRVGSNPWAVSKIKELDRLLGLSDEEKDGLVQMPLYNAGVIGGHSEDLLELFEDVSQILAECGPNGNNNMMALHYCLMKMLGDDVKANVLSGRPLTSPFKKYRDSDKFYFVHK